jgi:CBS domain containing-hemolysin-like protein
MARPIMTIVIINNVSNIIGSIVVGALAAGVFGSQWLGAFSATLTFLVIVFAEIIPKTIGERFAKLIAINMAIPVLYAARLMFPLIWFIEILTRPFSGKDSIQMTSEEEIRALTRLGQQTGAIEADESELIHRVFHLNDVTARDIMTPLSRIDALDGRRTLDEIRHELMTLTHTRLPVHAGSLNKVTGVVHLRDMLQALSNDRDSLPVQELAKPPSFIPEMAAGDDLLRHFQQQKKHLAIVVDAFGTVLGILTLEDVLEELVGDIVDETDIEPNKIQRVGKNEIIVDASAEMALVKRALKANFAPQGRIGEQLIAHLGHIPAVGEVIQLHDVLVTVHEATPRAVKRLRVIKA